MRELESRQLSIIHVVTCIKKTIATNPSLSQMKDQTLSNLDTKPLKCIMKWFHREQDKLLHFTKELIVQRILLTKYCEDLDVKLFLVAKTFKVSKLDNMS